MPIVTALCVGSEDTTRDKTVTQIQERLSYPSILCTKFDDAKAPTNSESHFLCQQDSCSLRHCGIIILNSGWVSK